VEAVFLRSPAVRDPDRLVAIYSHNPKEYGIPSSANSYPDYVDFRDHNEVFSGIIVFCARPVPMDTGEQTELIDTEVVSGNYFSELGVKAAVGRTFLPDEDSSLGLHPVTVLSYGFWQHRFGSDPNIVGKTLILNRYP